MKKPNKFYARVKRGAPTIFTVLSVAGVIATGILSARAANKTRNTEESEKSTVDNFKEGWKNYIPAIAVGGVTIVCSISSNVLNRHQRVNIMMIAGETIDTVMIDTINQNVLISRM